MIGLTVGDRVWFGDRVWIVRDICLASPSGEYAPCGPPHVRLIDPDDFTHEYRLLEADWHLLRPEMRSR